MRRRNITALAVLVLFVVNSTSLAIEKRALASDDDIPKSLDENKRIAGFISGMHLHIPGPEPAEPSTATDPPDFEDPDYPEAINQPANRPDSPNLGTDNTQKQYGPDGGNIGKGTKNLAKRGVSVANETEAGHRPTFDEAKLKRFGYPVGDSMKVIARIIEECRGATKPWSCVSERERSLYKTSGPDTRRSKRARLRRQISASADAISTDQTDDLGKATSQTLPPAKSIENETETEPGQWQRKVGDALLALARKIAAESAAARAKGQRFTITDLMRKMKADRAAERAKGERRRRQIAQIADANEVVEPPHPADAISTGQANEQGKTKPETPENDNMANSADAKDDAGTNRAQQALLASTKGDAALNEGSPGTTDSEDSSFISKVPEPIGEVSTGITGTAQPKATLV